MFFKFFLAFSFLTLFVIFSVVYYLNANEFLVVSFKTSFLNFYDSNKTLKWPKCGPFRKHAKQFSIRIDNETYPKSIPLSRNNSIDYECLNRNEKLKLILLWNTFFGSEEFYFGLGKKEPFIRHK